MGLGGGGGCCHFVQLTFVGCVFFLGGGGGCSIFLFAGGSCSAFDLSGPPYF